MSRWIWLLMIAVIVGGLVVYSMQPETVPVEVATVKRGDLSTFIEERAKTRFPEITKITMPLDGRINPIKSREGDKVSAGEVVAEMDLSDLKTEVFSAKTQVEQFDQLLTAMQVSLQSARAQVAATRARVEFSQGEYDRTSTLFQSKTVSPQEMARANYELIDSKMDLKQDEFTVTLIEVMEVAVNMARRDAQEKLDQKQRDLERATITVKADNTGVVLNRLVSNEQVLAAGETLLEIGDLDKLEVEVEVLTSDVTRIELGDEVEILGPSIGENPLPGKVMKIYPQGFTKTSPLGVEQQRVLVIVHFDPKPYQEWKAKGRSLGGDYRVRVKIYTETKTGVLQIPQSAIFRNANGDGWEVFAVRSGKVERVSVTLGLSNDQMIEVLSGLEEGDQVVLAPESSLTSGTQVEAKEIP